jgi:hypothetical protein
MDKVRVKETCLVIMTGLLVFWWIYKVDVLVYIAVAIGVIGAFIPFLAKWIDWAWYKLAEGMGWVMSKVLLSIVFYVFLFPIALLARMSKKDVLQLKKKPDSYWTKREHQYSDKDLDNAW